MNILIGCDPELFIKDTTTNEFISSHTFIPGTKTEPFPVPHGAIQVDGTALEFNIEPALDSETFIHNINSLKEYLRNEIHSKAPTCELSISSTAHFNPNYFGSLPPYVTELGCSPDFNAYTKTENNPPHTRKPFRTAAGHVHIGWGSDLDMYSPEHFKLCCALTKQLDIALFLPSLLFDTDNERRKLYGAPGSFRPKPYGMEYRVLSNQWITEDHLIHWVYTVTHKATNDLAQGFEYYQLIPFQTINLIAKARNQPAREKLIHKLTNKFKFIEVP